jgi:membrane protease YdiL (CAAX protease family)
MAHIATKRYSYPAQAGILAGLTIGGLFVGGLISSLVLLTKTGINIKSMDELLVPANANLLRLVQFIGVFFLFFLPAVVYARICHKNAAQHLGVKKQLNIIQFILAVVLIFSAIPLVAALHELTLKLPLGDFIKNKIQQSKVEYMKQAMVLGTMRSFSEYLLSLLLMAVLPGLFEEIFFRGALQNLFTRWFKNPVMAILLTAVIFSAFHFEYGDFLGRVFLGIVLGWVFYQTGNIWLNVLMHAAFNGLSVTGLYLATLAKVKMDPAAVDDKFNFTFTLIGSAIFIATAIIFYKDNQKKNNLPGVEIPPDNYEDDSNPSWTKTDSEGNKIS